MCFSDVEQSTLTSSSEIISDNNDIDVNKENEDPPVSKLPFILTEFFDVISSTDKKITAQCKNCTKSISGSSTSTGNFTSHYNVCFVYFFNFNFSYFLYVYFYSTVLYILYRNI